MKKLVLVSLGQIVKTDIAKSFDAFTAAVSEQSYPWLQPFARARVNGAFALDQAWYGTVDSYKKGNIDSDAFYDRLQSQLGCSIPRERFFDAWNAMCVVDQQSAQSLQDTIAYAKENDATLCIISATNKAQYDHIKGKLFEYNIDLESNPQLKIVTSFDHKTLDMKQLGQQAILGRETAGNSIISLHNALNTEASLGLSSADFLYHPFDTRVEGASLNKAVKEAVERLPSRTLTGAEEGKGNNDSIPHSLVSTVTSNTKQQNTSLGERVI